MFAFDAKKTEAINKIIKANDGKEEAVRDALLTGGRCNICLKTEKKLKEAAERNVVKGCVYIQ